MSPPLDPRPEAVEDPPRTQDQGRRLMDLIVVLGVLAVWLLLQLWILPRLGVST